MLATFAEIKASNAINIAGVGKDTAEFRDYLNEATRRLLRRGDWSGTVIPIHVCLKKGCVVWPRYVGSVRKLNLCHHPVAVKNLWWQFLPDGAGQPGCYQTYCGGHASFSGIDHAPTYNSIAGDARNLRVYPVSSADLGLTVTLFGVDNNLQPIQETLVIANPYVQSVNFFTRLDRVLKDVTTGNVTLYAYDSVNAVLEDLAVYEPTETNPSYMRYRLNVAGSATTNHGVVAMVKLKFIPVVGDTDLVLIENPDAIKDMIQSIRFGEAGDQGNKAALEASAIRELNLQLTDESSDEQTAVDVQPFNGAAIGGQRMF